MNPDHGFVAVGSDYFLGINACERDDTQCVTCRPQRLRHGVDAQVEKIEEPMRLAAFFSAKFGMQNSGCRIRDANFGMQTSG
jgi:hypothetical protein